MDQSKASEFVKELVQEATRVDGALNDARAVVSELDERLHNVRAAIDSLVKIDASLLPVPSATQDDEVRRRVAGIVRTRVKSADLAANLVMDLGRPATRSQILEFGEEQGLIPETWTHPANALNNAISRAAERGLITKLPDGRFAPNAVAEGMQITEAPVGSPREDDGDEEESDA